MTHSFEHLKGDAHPSHPASDDIGSQDSVERETAHALATGLNWREFFVRLGEGTLPYSKPQES